MLIKTDRDGFNHPISSEITPQAVYAERRAWLARSGLAGAGLREILNYSLTSPALLDAVDPEGAERRIVLPNPISADQSVLRDRHEGRCPLAIEILQQFVHVQDQRILLRHRRRRCSPWCR